MEKPISITQVTSVRRLLSYTSPLSSKETGIHGQLCFHLLTPLCHTSHRNPLASENYAFRRVTGRWNSVGAELVLRMPREGGRSHQVAPARLVNLASPHLRPGSRSCELWRKVMRCQVRMGHPRGHFCRTPHSCLHQTQPDPSSHYPHFGRRLTSGAALRPQPQPRSNPVSKLSFLMVTSRTGTVSTFAPGSQIVRFGKDKFSN